MSGFDVSSGSGQSGVNFDVNAQIESTGDVGVQKKTSTGTTSDKDILESSLGTTSQVSYASLAGKPGLTKPSTSSSLKEETQQQQRGTTEDQASYNPAIQKEYISQFNSALESYRPPLTDAQKSWAQLKLRDPEAEVDASQVDPKFIDEVVHAASSLAAHNVRQEAGLPSSWQPPVADDSTFITAYSASLDKVLQNYVKSIPLLFNPQEVIAKMKFAFYHPELGDPNALKALADAGIPGKVSADMAKKTGVGVPPSWKPVAQFDATVTAHYDTAFEGVVSTYADKRHLSDQQKQLLITLHYHPELNASNPDQAKIVADLEDDAVVKIRGQYGIPSGVSPTTKGYPVAGQASYDQSIQSNYAFSNEYAVRNHINQASPPLSAAHQQALKSALADPQADVPAHIRETATTIQTQSQQDISEKYSLPTSTWLSEGTSSTWTGEPSTLSGLTYVADAQAVTTSIASSISTASSISNQAGSVNVADYLKIIGEALTALSQAIYKAEGLQAAAGKGLSQAQFETSMNRLNEREVQRQKQLEQQKKMEKQKKKADKLGLGMKIIGAILTAVSVIATVATLGAMTPVAMAVTLAFTSLSVMDQAGLGVTDKMFSGIGKLFEAMGMSAGDAKILATVLTIVVVVLVCRKVTAGKGPLAGMMGSQLLGNTTVIADIAKKIPGVSDQTAMILQVVLVSVIMMGSVVKSGAKLAKDQATMANQLMSKLANGEQAIANYKAAGQYVQAALKQLEVSLVRVTAQYLTNPVAGEKTLGGFMACLNTTAAGTGFGNSYLEASIDKMKADLEQLNGQANANATVLQDIIDSLKAMVKKLQDLINALVDWNSSVNQMQSDKWGSAVATMSSLYRAT